jgi:1-acyl-sn-glycerol-3-phosphate acyltransferase
MLAGRTLFPSVATSELSGARVLRVAQRASSLVWSCLQALGRHDQERSPAERAFAFHQLCADVCRSHQFEVHAHGQPPDGAAVLVANHLSYLDPIMVAAHKPLGAIGKLEVSGWPVVGDIGKTHGMIFIERGNVHAGAVVLRRALRTLAAGVPVLNFPEGTTTNGDVPLLGFQRGIFGVARLARVPVVPVAIRFESPDLHWVGDSMFLPHYLRTAGRTRTIVHVRYGEPLDAPVGVRAELVAAAARARITKLYEECR